MALASKEIYKLDERHGSLDERPEMMNQSESQATDFYRNGENFQNLRRRACGAAGQEVKVRGFKHLG